MHDGHWSCCARRQICRVLKPGPMQDSSGNERSLHSHTLFGRTAKGSAFKTVRYHQWDEKRALLKKLQFTLSAPPFIYFSKGLPVLLRRSHTNTNCICKWCVNGEENTLKTRFETRDRRDQQFLVTVTSRSRSWRDRESRKILLRVLVRYLSVVNVHMYHTDRSWSAYCFYSWKLVCDGVSVVDGCGRMGEWMG